MDDYYAYIIGREGHILRRIDLRFENETEAIEHVETLVDGYVVELWQRHRIIKKFKYGPGS